MPQLTIPMVLILGSKDRLISLFFVPLFTILNYSITLIELEKFGYCPYDECLEQFNFIMLNWSTALNSQLSNI